jgi:hypothetical protein
MSQVSITVKEFMRMYSDIIGFTSDSDCALDVINKARAVLYPGGNWDGTISYEIVRVVDGILVLPSHLDSIKSARICNYDIGVSSMIDKDGYNNCGAACAVRLSSRLFLPFQLTEPFEQLSFTALNPKDDGKTILITYIDSKKSTRSESITLSYRNPAKLTYRPQEITGLTKDETISQVYLALGSNPKKPTKSGFLPSDTNPSFSAYCLNVTGECNIAIEAKRRYRPYTSSDNNTNIDINPEALSSAIIAVKVKDARAEGWIQEYAQAIKFATDFLKAEQQDIASNNQAAQSVDYDDSMFNSFTNLNN